MSSGLKPCTKGCGKFIYWDESFTGKQKWVEEGSHILHTTPRCMQLLEQQGKSLDVFSQENKEEEEDA